MNVTEFGDELIRSGDLDPVYIAIQKAALPQDLRARLSVAYWCFYSLGAAARIAESKSDKKFWEAMHTAAVNESRPDGSKPWPRGAERRHFRGAQAVRAVEALISKYKSPVKLVEDWCAGGTFQAVTSAVKSNTGFGDWIAFKVADMSERVLEYSTDFSNCHLGIYKDPRQGAATVFIERHGNRVKHEGYAWDYAITDDQFVETCNELVAEYRKRRFKAPPTNDRLVNIQEIETILCKYKSHLKGHYPMYKDTHEVLHGLHGWGDLASQLETGLRENAKKKGIQLL